MKFKNDIELTVIHPANKQTLAYLVESMFEQFYELVDQTASAIWLAKGLELVKLHIPKKTRQATA